MAEGKRQAVGDEQKPKKRKRLESYNHERVFGDDAEMQEYVKSNGWILQKSLQRIMKGGTAFYYTCKASKWGQVKCKHMMLVVKEENGLILAKTTDGGFPHDHFGVRTPKRGPPRYAKEKEAMKLRTSMLSDDSDDDFLGLKCVVPPVLKVNNTDTATTSRRLNFSDDSAKTTEASGSAPQAPAVKLDEKPKATVTPKVVRAAAEPKNETTAATGKNTTDASNQILDDMEADLFEGASPELIAELAKIHKERRAKERAEEEERVASLFANASDELVEKLRELHEKKKRELERKAVSIFSTLPTHKQRQILDSYTQLLK